jgi:hypothetical protein
MHLSTVSATVDEFLQRQAQIARRQAAPPTPPPAVIIEEPKPISEVYGPQTPQKNPYGTVIQNGCLTPPITPEGEQFTYGHVVKSQAASMYPTTPTPDHQSNVQHQGQYFHNTYLHPQHM